MKKLKKTIMLMLGILTAGTLTLNAQNFQGIATYQSARKMGNMSIKGDGMSPEMEKQIQESLKKQMQKEYELKFNLTESTWAEVESLEGGPTSASAGGMVMRFSSGGGTKYKNTAENLFLNETEVFSKPFLVQSELKNREWQLTNETKKIGNYNAQKAIFSEIVERTVISFDNDDKESTVTSDTINIEAWFTPEIPVSQGPDDFWGLPGLIMEISDGKLTYLCTKVILNPEEGVKIKKPSKGKKVTPEELKVIQDEKTKEMMEKYSQGGGDGKSFKIKIGGN
ncbi:GLPGLI family protein [Roseivirga sp.]|uniref:GLPGLI family protein n=1 Tax=Roseivirga sp. TaxID=1964215 RepID=UPI002B26CAC3|nr:GLPGLI family protein [Roseivirga sp.]